MREGEGGKESVKKLKEYCKYEKEMGGKRRLRLAEKENIGKM